MGGPGGSGTWWRQQLLRTKEPSVIAFTGYVSPDSDGHKIISTAQKRENGEYINRITFNEFKRESQRWREKEYPFHCDVEHFHLSAHNDRTKTIQGLREMNPELVMLTHGSKRALKSVSLLIAREILTSASSFFN